MRLLLIILALLACSPVAARGTPDPYADSVVSSSSTLNPTAALGAPDGCAAHISGSLTLDMGAGEDATGQLTLHYLASSTPATVSATWLGRTITFTLPAGTPGQAASYVLPWKSWDPAWRSIQISVTSGTLQLDAIQTASYIGQPGRRLPPMKRN